jgi:hypothetical protein
MQLHALTKQLFYSSLVMLYVVSNTECVISASNNIFVLLSLPLIAHFVYPFPVDLEKIVPCNSPAISCENLPMTRKATNKTVRYLDNFGATYLAPRR